MNQQTMHDLTLFNLLARRWRLPAAVTGATFSGDGTAVAFSVADGSVSIASTADNEPPESRIRVSGDLAQTTIRPRERPATPLISVPGMAEGSAPICAWEQGGFLIGAQDCRVFPLGTDGTPEEPVMWLKKPPLSVVHAKGVTVASDGAMVRILRDGMPAFQLGRDDEAPVTTLALSPGGDHLALACGDQLEVWVVGDEIMRLDVLPCASTPTTIHWSGVAPWLACALGDNGFTLVDVGAGRTHTVAGFPMPVRSVSWSTAANAVAASGAFRIAAWSMDAPPVGGQKTGALETGRTGLVPVEVVAAHPSKKLIAAGYANGQIVVAQIGQRDELVIRQGGGSVAALGWSADGNHLAIGDDDGEAAITSFPSQMFK